jgi:hypothetical protein
MHELDREGEIDLVAVAGGNQLLDAVDRAGVGICVEPGAPVADAGRGAAGSTAQPVVRGLGGQFEAFGEAPETRQRPVRGRPARRCRFRFEQVTQLVIQRDDRPRRARGEFGERPGQRAGIMDLETVDRLLEKPGGGFARRRPPVLEKCGEPGAYLRFR